MKAPYEVGVNGRVWIAPALITALFVAMTLAIWWPSNFVRLSSFAIGEQFEAYHGALNIERFGWQWGGLQDEATNPDPAAHPYLYTHHGNNGIYFSYLLRKLGILSLPLQNAVSIFGSAGGLLAAFLCIRSLTGSVLFATLTMALLALDYELIRDWSVNIHRGLTYLSIFVAVYVFHEAARRNFLHWGWNLAALLACLNLMGTDYLYFIFTGWLIVAWIVLGLESSWRQRIWCVAGTGMIFVAAFALRQAQVAYAVGWSTFSQEFVIQALNRLHLEFLYPGDWAKVWAEFYATHPLLNTGTTAPTSAVTLFWSFWINTCNAALANVLGVTAPGQLNFIRPVPLLAIAVGALVLLDFTGRRVEAQRLSLIASIFALAVIAAGVPANLGYEPLIAKVVIVVFAAGCAIAVYLCGLWPNEPAAEGNDGRRPMLFGLSVLAGCGGLMLTLPGYFVGWYPQFQLDSICVAVWLALLPLPYLIGDALRGKALAALTLVIIVKAASLSSQLLPLPNPGGDHIAALRKLRGQPTVSNFTPASTASYTHAFSALIKPEGLRKLLSGGSAGPKDFWLLTEHDSETNPIYRQPKYFVFYKGLVIFPDDWSVIDEYVPVSEGNDYAIYSLPSRRR
jgi:hypothetical protein